MKTFIAALAFACAPALAQDEVPFIVTPDQVTLAMLQLAAVGPRDHVLDLGSGDGRIVITAAKRFGASGQGVEIVPDLVAQSRDNARKAGVADRTDFRVQDLFETDLSRATVVTMYLLPEVNLQLRDRVLALAPGSRVVSHDWDMGEWAPDRTVTVEVPDKTIGREKFSRVHLWVVPARLHGAWCAPEGRIEIVQRFQTFSATAYVGAGKVPAMVFDGRIDGNAFAAVGRHLAKGVVEGARLRLQQLGAPASALEGRAFSRC